MQIRRATAADQPAILELVPRLVAFGPPEWRDPAAMSATDRKVIGAALQSLSDDPIVLVAVLNDQTVAGFLHLHSVTDYYTERKNGHVADLVVAQAHEGGGIARRLLAAAEDWARAQRFDWLTISVFRDNRRAAQTYERMGYQPEIIRLLKTMR